MPNIIGTAPNQVPTNADLGTMAFEDKVNYQTTSQLQGFRNRIINGDFRIDQRNAGASVTPASGSNVYTLDRWLLYAGQASKLSVQQNAGSVTPPPGFSNYLGCTSLSSYSVGSGDLFILEQYIEGLNIADFSWGTSNAKTVTLSFWVRSSLTGSFGGSLRNSADNRCYPFTYSISAANTWEQKSVTIAGDTTGTWLTTSGRGVKVCFTLGNGSTYSGTAGAWTGGTITAPTGSTSVVGTNGATFYITGVQLEKGSTATSFDYRPYGTELALCQRYYSKSYETNTAPGTATTSGIVTIGVYASGIFTWETSVQFPVQMRSAPSVSYWDGAGNASRNSYLGNGNTTFTHNINASGVPFNASSSGFLFSYNASTTSTYLAQYAASAEL